MHLDRVVKQVDKLVKSKKKLKPLMVWIFLIIGAWVFVSFGFGFAWKGRVLPGVSIAGVDLGRSTERRARAVLASKVDQLVAKPIIFVYEDQEWSIPSESVGLKYDIPSSVEAALMYGKGGFLEIPLIVKSMTKGIDIPMQFKLNEKALEASLSAIAADIELPSIPPSIKVLETPDPVSGMRVIVEEGEFGKIVDLNTATRILRTRFALLSANPVEFQVEEIPPLPDRIDPRLTTIRAQRLLDKRLMLSYAENGDKVSKVWELSGKDIINFLAFDGGFQEERVASYSAVLAQSINRPAQNATFEFRNGRVVEFSQERNGLFLPVQAATATMVQAFSDLEMNEEIEVKVDLPVEKQEPEIKTADANDLGIKELLGRGVSTYTGSISNRKHNIALASSRIAGVLVAPGETFSFNEAVGDITAATGYRQSYIIKDGRTILDDGGGVCQVSTTVFRAALDSGLPIVKRYAHSYRVTYYEQNSKPGFDATVFSPSVDLKFLNDTPGNILIQTQPNTNKNELVVEIFGTSDGRKSIISNYKMWDVTPPPPDLYQDDPTLPQGVIKQVDWKAWGSKVKYDYTVERDGKVIYSETFYSNFRPWQSVFLQGIGGV